MHHGVISSHKVAQLPELYKLIMAPCFLILVRRPWGAETKQGEGNQIVKSFGETALSAWLDSLALRPVTVNVVRDKTSGVAASLVQGDGECPQMDNGDKAVTVILEFIVSLAAKTLLYFSQLQVKFQWLDSAAALNKITDEFPKLSFHWSFEEHPTDWWRTEFD